MTRVIHNNIRDVRVFDGRRTLEHRSVLIENGKIARIISADRPGSSGAEILSCC